MSQALVTKEEMVPTINAEVVPSAMASMVQDILAMEKVADILSKATMLPAAYVGNPNNIIVAMLRGQGLGLDPIQAMEGIAMIHGKATLYGDHFLGIIIAAPGYEGHKEMTFGEIQEARGATCVFYRGGREYRATYTVDDANRAKLWSKGGAWTSHPFRMLQLKARAFAGRDGFADALRGILIREIAEEEQYDALGNLITDKRKVTRDELIAQQQVKPPAPEKVLEVVDVVEVVEVVEGPQNDPQMPVKFSPKKKATKKVTKKAPDKTPPPPTKGMAK